MILSRRSFSYSTFYEKAWSSPRISLILDCWCRKSFLRYAFPFRSLLYFNENPTGDPLLRVYRLQSFLLFPPRRGNSKSPVSRWRLDASFMRDRCKWNGLRFQSWNFGIFTHPRILSLIKRFRRKFAIRKNGIFKTITVVGSKFLENRENITVYAGRGRNGVLFVSFERNKKVLRPVTFVRYNAVGLGRAVENFLFPEVLDCVGLFQRLQRGKKWPAKAARRCEFLRINWNGKRIIWSSQMFLSQSAAWSNDLPFFFRASFCFVGIFIWCLREGCKRINKILVFINSIFVM